MRLLCMAALSIVLTTITDRPVLADDIKPNFELRMRSAISLGKLNALRPDGDVTAVSICQFDCPTQGYTVTAYEGVNGGHDFLRMTTGPIIEYGDSTRANILVGGLNPPATIGSAVLVNENAQLSDNYCDKDGPLTGPVYRITRRQDSHISDTNPLAGPISNFCLTPDVLPGRFNAYSADGTTVPICVPHTCGDVSAGYDEAFDFHNESYAKWWSRLHQVWEIEVKFFEELADEEDNETDFITNGLVGISEAISLPDY